MPLRHMVKVPVEISLSTLRKPSVGLHHRRHYRRTIYGQETSCQQMGFRNVSKLQFPFRGCNSEDQVRAVVRSLYDETDGGRGQYVAVKGDEQRIFPVLNELRQPPAWRRFLLQQANIFYICWIFDGVESGELPINTVADEQQQQQQQEGGHGHGIGCHRLPRPCIGLPGSWFWACIKAQRAAKSNHSLFAFRELLIELLKKNDSHLRYWFCWPLSLCLYGKWHCSSGDIPICPSRPPVGLYNGRHYLERFTAKNVRANGWAFRNLSKLSFPYRGYNRLESVRGEVKRLYDEKDRGRGLYVTVKGDEIKDFFVPCSLPVCEMKREVFGVEAPKYTDLYELSQQSQFRATIT
ncbi:hypothetical protein CEXT_782821 [Caerostris extrusa]|uniref:Uncharacterized protein n=1 Tax=Caerostris extrusa TaxID=172846 RepID=A0AAV4RRG0_CAEEX|nr:hypothetical protein CEXT_782821 [Caerostris extrusa]